MNRELVFVPPLDTPPPQLPDCFDATAPSVYPLLELGLEVQVIKPGGTSWTFPTGSDD